MESPFQRYPYQYGRTHRLGYIDRWRVEIFATQIIWKVKKINQLESGWNVRWPTTTFCCEHFLPVTACPMRSHCVRNWVKLKLWSIIGKTLIYRLLCRWKLFSKLFVSKVAFGVTFPTVSTSICLYTSSWIYWLMNYRNFRCSKILKNEKWPRSQIHLSPILHR